jgi:pimeloyl-ACP methyl ester carboxylesterase
VPYVLANPRLWVERHGAGEPLLLLTGFGLSAAVFEPVLPSYAERFEVLAFDPRGSGRSESPRRPTSMVEMAADAARVLDALGISSAHVLGVSMGGMVAQELALRFPERVRGLVLAGTWPGGPLAIRPRVRELAALGSEVRGAAGGNGRSWRAPLLFSDAFRREHPEQVAELLELFARHRPETRGLAYQLLATVYHDTYARLPSLQAPTLVLHGERDALVPGANARLLAARIPDAELAVVPGGHAFALEQPERTLEVLLDWFARHGPIAPGRRRATARLEPLTRPFGLPAGAARTGVSLAALARRRAVRTSRRSPPGSRPRA